MKLLLFPGDVVCDIAGLSKERDYGQVLRNFFNRIFWGAVATLVAVAAMV